MTNGVPSPAAPTTFQREYEHAHEGNGEKRNMRSAAAATALFLVVGIIAFMSPSSTAAATLSEGEKSDIDAWVKSDEVGRCKLDPSLKAPCLQPLNLRLHTSLSV